MLLSLLILTFLTVFNIIIPWFVILLYITQIDHLISFAKAVALSLQLYLKETPTEVFSREICVIFKNTFFIEHILKLLLFFSDFFLKLHELFCLIFRFLINTFMDERAGKYDFDIFFINWVLNV